MKSKDILYSAGNNDECYTPRYAVEALLPYLQKDKIYWLPFDKDDSEFVNVLRKNDFIISNPPFTNKRKIFERALSFGKPFALIMSNTWLNDSAPKVLFADKDLQLLMFRNRIKFLNNGVVNNKITFSSSYFCWNLLPKQIIISDR